MLEVLGLWGLPRSRRVREALALVPPRTGWPKSLEFVDIRMGPVADREARRVEPSRRLSVLLAELLEIQPGASVHLPSSGFAFLRALVEAMGAEVVDGSFMGSVDRILLVEPAPPAALKVNEEGFTLRLDVRAGREELEKIVGDAAHLGLLGFRLGTPDGDRGRTIKHLLELEGLQIRGLARQPETPQDRHFLNGVKTTWNPAAGSDPNLTPEERVRLEDARDFFHLGYVEQFAGDLVEAIECYRASSALFPTAEAHTFLAWSMQLLGRSDQAIEECRRAIAIDPDFGNPYNDIGAYLLDLGKPREALPWLQRAQTAPRYATPHYAHANAGRALMLMGHPSEARQEFLRALEISPGYPPAVEGLQRLRG